MLPPGLGAAHRLFAGSSALRSPHTVIVVVEPDPEGPWKSPDPLHRYLLLIAQGDEVAFAALYEKTAAWLLRQIRFVLIDPSHAEEVAQEVFLEIWQTATKYQPDRGAVMPWMLTMARRRAIDRIRASQSSRARDLRIGRRDLEDDYDHVIAHMEVRSESARVQRGMKALTPLQRQAVELSYFDELTYSEISILLKVPVGTVRTRVRDGILRLRATVGVEV